jgi:mannose-6-phosphate isomerase-like protein (cupin superfamily)
MEVRSRAGAAPFVTKDGSTIRELMHTERQSLAEATVAPGQTTERHYHARSEELYSFLDGGGRLEVDGELIDAVAGDTVLIPPGSWHTFTGGPSGARFLCCCAPPYAHDDTYVT